MRILRLLSLPALAALAAASQAVVFNFTGTTTGLTPGQSTFTSTQVAGASQSTSPFDLVTSGLVSLTGGPGSTFVYGAGTANSLTVSFNALTDGNGGTASSFASTGVLSGTGAFLPYAGDTVAVASNTLPGIGFNTFSINGVVNPTPEPASLAALGVGVAALARRRKRA